jgi:hypothetical protein
MSGASSSSERVRGRTLRRPKTLEQAVRLIEAMQLAAVG